MERCRNNRRTYYVYLPLEILPKMNVLNLEVEILGPQDIYISVVDLNEVIS